MNQINFFSEDISFELSNHQKHVDWIFSFIHHFNFQCGELSFIYCSDEHLLKMNKEHLRHDYYTDIITFNYVADTVLNGDIFISIDRVMDNSKSFNTNFADELRRVMAHGVLHLIGFNDKSDEEQKKMTEAENVCLEMYK